MKNSNKEKRKILFAKVLLVLLIIIILLLICFHFFLMKNTENDNKNINSSSTNAIHKALKDITANFNKDKDVINYQGVNDVKLKAYTEGDSIYIDYITDDTVSYEFVIRNGETLFLDILVEKSNDEEKNKFNIVYGFLVDAVQERLNNKSDISGKINDFLVNDIPCKGLSKNEVGNKTEYKINILDKIYNSERKSE